MEFIFFNLVGYKETPLLRKDEDYFFFFTTEQNISQRLVASKKFNDLIKYKVLVLIFPQTLEIYAVGTYLTMSNYKSDFLFLQSPHNFQGETLKVSVPNYGSAIEMKLDKFQHLKATRGLYVLWIREIEKKFNFSCAYFTSSNGASGIQLENGMWSGGVGDVVNGLAHMSLDISHIYSRQGFVEWASPFHYRGLVFVVHKAKYHFPKDILLRPFTPALWSMFIPCVIVSALWFKVKSIIGFRIRNAAAATDSSSKTKKYQVDDESWSNQRIAGYITASFLGQPWNLPDRIVNSVSVRILITFWLFFAWVTATAYQAKLTSLMGFPMGSFVPTCFQELLSSDFEVGINALGKGESAYQAFISGGVDVYHGLFAKSAVHPNATECVLKAVAENFACISGEGVVAYAIARSVSLKNGESPLQFSDSKANFVEGGVIYQKRWIYRHQFDQTIRNAMSMGLVEKWWQWHMNSVRADKRKSDKAQGKRLTSDENGDDDDSDGLKIDKLISSLLCCSSLLLVGFIILCVEILAFPLLKRKT
ncbi:unnamed protein product [Orchesella dallaii]|uniref:Uncharacterized protein n=1 Tax=Orchesella dallaii TaxID=48710 RepID=A0ABP1RS67_9HEXA